MPHFVFEIAKFNPMEPMKNGKKVLNLALGDPKQEHGYKLPEDVNKSVMDVLNKGTFNGYSHH
jgi:hypothetical protein